MSLQYATAEDVNRYLRANDKIKIGPPGQADNDISTNEVVDFLQDAEDRLDGLLNGVSINSKIARYIVIRWACVDIYTSLYPRSSVNEIPQAVLRWQEKADEALQTAKEQATGAAGAIGDWEDQL